MKYVTRTLNPLHFEDLEPHRFEDLVRQLAYDFRDWSALEATGRAGSDEGFDIRGREILRGTLDEQNPEEGSQIIEERIWLIQCKREKAISPRKIEKYIEESLNRSTEAIYGIIFVAPCHFSKRVRDVFINKIRTYGVKEFQLWGREEIEDLLFQPRNDHLLFAYFQISLKTQRRTVKARIQDQIAIKRKAIRYLGGVSGHHYKAVLLRDPNEDRYPYSGEIDDFDSFPRWKAYYFRGHYHSGLKFLFRKYFSYLADDRVHFDFAACWDDSRPSGYEDPWNQKKQPFENRDAVWRFWSNIPENKQAWLEMECLVPYERVIAIDEDGDNIFPHPHIYIPFVREHGPFESTEYVTLKTVGGEGTKIYPEIQNRIEYFPKELRDKPR